MLHLHPQDRYDPYSPGRVHLNPLSEPNHRRPSRSGPSTGPTRSDRLSCRRFIASAHSSTERMRRLNSTGRFRLHMPDRSEDLQPVGRVDLGDGPAADAREHVPFHTAPPVLRATGCASHRGGSFPSAHVGDM